LKKWGWIVARDSYQIRKGDVKELLGFFINYVFVGVFQYDFGPENML